MEFIEIKGARVPALGLGTWAMSGADCGSAVRSALDLGYRHIDTAEMYGNETEVGTALRQSGVARDAIFLTTKVPPGSLAAAALRRSAEASLKRLATEYVDLLLVHWPNPEVPLGETLAALARLKAEGKARHVGVSNFTLGLLAEAVERHGADLLCNQVEYHPYLSQAKLLAAARRYGMMLTAYCPVARGAVFRDPILVEIGRRYGKTGGQVALRWLVEQPGVAAIPKAAGRAHLAENLAIFDFALSAEDRAAIDRLQGDRRLVNVGWAPRWDTVD